MNLKKTHICFNVAVKKKFCLSLEVAIYFLCGQCFISTKTSEFLSLLKVKSRLDI